jgi:hypothetical protein
MEISMKFKTAANESQGVAADPEVAPLSSFKLSWVIL